MPANFGQGGTATMPMRIAMPEPSFQPIVTSDQEGSSPDYTDNDGVIRIPEEDARSAVGVSISRAQTRLMSPQTPAAEKAAALADIEGGGLFDGAGDDTDDHQLLPGGKDPHPQAQETKFTPPSTPNDKDDVDLPSPWRASPKTFERPKTGEQSYQQPPATSMLSELNVRRYFANFNLPSLPKSPSLTSFKDFSVPSLSSILSSTRSHSPLRKSSVRSKRASTYGEPALSTSYGSDFANYTAPDLDRRPGELPRPRRVPETNGAQISGIRTQIRDASSEQGHRDDSRWENVQEQVNSRMKAIKDSLQDSSIKLPSMPNLSSFNLGSFRPDFTRNRAHSDVSAPKVSSNEGTYHNNADDMRNGDLAPRGRQVVANISGISDAQKGPMQTQPDFDKALENLTGDIVIMGGYRGSILRSAKPPHRQLWVPVKVGLNIRRVNLEVGLEPEDEEKNGKCFVNRETKEEYPVNFFDIGHWKQYAWSPCIAPALPPLNPPENKTLFGSVSDKFPSMPSLPLPGRKPSLTRQREEKSDLGDAANTATSKINDLADPTTARALDPQMSSPSSQTTHKGPQSTIPLPDAIAYLKRTLDATLAFKAELASIPLHTANNVYPPLAVLYANNTPTVAAARVASREAIRHADAYDDLQFGSGDGVCLARAAMLPDGYTCVKGGR
ncbi:hypothetical protein P7C71_g3859, partial [Lecanoromycetidae sp. Uapishka_2]